MKDVKKWLPGALISIALIAAILYFVDFGAMMAAIRSANYFFLAGAMAPVLCVDARTCKGLADLAAG
ncbi:MAG: hypothetical protein IPO36_09900 [Anaerolineales bacterium]|nr:hypothetical protein [Anaerolineales bacterium]